MRLEGGQSRLSMSCCSLFRACVWFLFTFLPTNACGTRDMASCGCEKSKTALVIRHNVSERCCTADRSSGVPLQMASGVTPSTRRKRKLQLLSRQGASGSGAQTAAQSYCGDTDLSSTCYGRVMDVDMQGVGDASEVAEAKRRHGQAGLGADAPSDGGHEPADRGWTCCVCNTSWVVISVVERQRHLEQCLCLLDGEAVDVVDVEPAAGAAAAGAAVSADTASPRSLGGHAAERINEGWGDGSGGAQNLASNMALDPNTSVLEERVAPTDHSARDTMQCHLCGEPFLSMSAENIARHEAECLQTFLEADGAASMTALCNLCGKSLEGMCPRDRWAHENSCLRDFEAAGWDSEKDADEAGAMGERRGGMGGEIILNEVQDAEGRCHGDEEERWDEDGEYLQAVPHIASTTGLRGQSERGQSLGE